MKSVALLLFAVAAAVLVSWLVFSDGTRREPVPAFPSGGETADRAARERLDALEERIRDLSARVDGIRDGAERGAPREPALPSAPGSSRASVGELDKDPRWYLDRYVASFEGGGAGSEYFRLVVDAYASDLLDPIVALAGEEARPIGLRKNLIAMLGTPRFAGNWAAVGPLVGHVKRESDAAVPAVRALLVIGDAECGRSLEGFACWIRTTELRRATFAVVVSLAGAEADRAVMRLLPCAQEDEEARQLLALARGLDPDALLELFRAASTLELPVRAAAADRIGEFRTDPLREFARAWHGTEPEADVRRRLERSMAKQSEKPSWAPDQAVGPPNANLAEDDALSWASQVADGGIEWIELAFPPLRASALRVFEGLSGGAITEVRARGEGGEWSTLWAGTQSDTTPGEYRFEFTATTRPITRIKLVLDTNRSRNWNEIDAVELSGPDGASWAIAATASSYFGQASKGRK